MYQGDDWPTMELCELGYDLTGYVPCYVYLCPSEPLDAIHVAQKPVWGGQLRTYSIRVDRAEGPPPGAGVPFEGLARWG